MHISQEHFTTIVYAKFGGQTKCIMGNWKIVNSLALTIISLRERPLLYEIWGGFCRFRSVMVAVLLNAIFTDG